MLFLQASPGNTAGIDIKWAIGLDLAITKLNVEPVTWANH